MDAVSSASPCKVVNAISGGKITLFPRACKKGKKAPSPRTSLLFKRVFIGNLPLVTRVGECVYEQSVRFPQQYATGLPTRHLPVSKELARNRLTQYFGLALPLSGLWEHSSQTIPFTNERRGEERSY